MRRIQQKSKKIFLSIFAAVILLLTGCTSAIEEGTQFLEAGDYVQAKESFQQSVEKGRDLGEAYRGLGICYWEQEDYGQAAAAFGKALDNGAQKTATLYNFLGICELKTGNPEKAIYYFENGQELPGAEGELLREMAFNEIAAYEQIGDYVAARDKLKLYVSAYPEDERAEKELEFWNTQAPEIPEGQE